MPNAGDCIAAENASWTFGGDVGKHFDDHVSKSVPLYLEGHELVLKVSDFFIADDSVCYDLGCSTGQLTTRLATRCAKKRAKFIGVDPEPCMVAEAEKKGAGCTNLSFVCADALDLTFDKSDLIICYYTMQFIRPRNRQDLFNRIYEALNWGGGLILFEKVRAPDARFQDLASIIYNDHKLDQGYTGEEIIAKTRSLKGVLEPFSTRGNLDLMARAGFVDVMTIMKWVCFEGFLAIK